MLNSSPDSETPVHSVEAQVETLLNAPVRPVASSPELHARIMAEAERMACEPRAGGRLVTFPRFAAALATAAALVLVLRPADPGPASAPSPIVSVSGGEAIAFLSAPVREMTHTPYEQEWAHLRNDVLSAVAYAGSVVPSP